MNQNIDLLHGKILPSLTALALPIMATSLVQTAYNLTDMAWIGQVGSDAVAAVGAAGMYMWLSSGLVTIARMGGQIKAAHAIGEGNKEAAGFYAGGALQFTPFLAVLFALMVNLFAWELIGFLGLSNPAVIADAVRYLRITCGLIIFPFMNQTLTGLYTAAGNSRTPFMANCIGMGVNMVLDPVLILGLGPFPRLEAVGAAIATVTAQGMVMLVLLYFRKSDPVLFLHVRLMKRVPAKFLAAIIKIGVPSGFQSMVYCLISMILTRFVAVWGDAAVAVLRVGSQIESISWTTAEGFGTAINAFVGQNFGGKQYKRVKDGYMTAAVIVFIWGCLTTAVLVFGRRPVMSVFIHEPEVVLLGMEYLRVLGYSQMFMCIELMTVGALSGQGKTLQCSVITIVLTTARIPFAMIFGKMLGLNGIWWAFTVSSMLKGVLFFVYYLGVLRQLLREPGAKV